MATVPTLAELFLNNEDAHKYDLSSLKIIYISCAHLGPRIPKALKQRYPNLLLLQLYGTTETWVLTAQDPSDTESTSVGVAVPGVSIKVADVETRATLGPNQRGEICARSPCLMKDYLGANSSCHLDEEGYYRTGDLGYYDNHKRFYIVDRLKDIISFIGDKVSPQDVEMVLMRHEAVLEVAVVGKPAPVVGEEPVAFVVLRPGAAATESELVDFVVKEVSPHMRLRGGVRFVSELPRNPRRKLLRRKLREMLLNELE